MIGNLEETPGTESIILPVVTGLAEKESVDMYREHLFEINLSKVKEEQSNIMRNEVEIIEGFMIAMAKREEAEDTSQTIEKSLMVGKESRKSKKVKPKGMKVAMAEETAEGPGAAYQGSKQKTIIPQSSKGKKMTGRGPSVSMNHPPLDDHLDER
ncbi:hypothetical protein HAX54_005349 [Datura stramonium]|uniref:Uncharacterized protein n=1 Tax=Datura stramonium TaxID=4076 RepID=A0ABS8T8J3_DATST|nr:hypothetical protein [Datura stramonium]